MPKKIVGIIMAIALVAVFVPNLSAQPVTLLSEGFEGSTYPPTGWNQIINNTTYTGSYPATWYRGNYSSSFQHGSAGSYCWWSYSTQNEWMITPPINLTGYTEAYLQFSSGFYRTTESDVHNYICVSTDNGSTWQDTIDDPIHTVAGSGWVYINDAPNPLIYDISDHVGQTIRIGWNYRFYNTTGGSRGIWTFDDVLVTGESGGGPGPSDSLDLELVTILRPNTEEQGGVSFTPGCKIYNNTDDTVPASVLCRFTDMSDMQVVYEKVVGDFPCEPGYTSCEAFDDFTPEGGKQYKALFVVTNENDVDPSNDNMEKKWSAPLGTDVTPIEVLSPSDDQVSAFKPSARYAERAGKTITASLICKIEGGAFNAIEYTDTLMHDFSGMDTFTAEFKEVTVLTGGTYTVTFWAENPLDASNISKPSAVKNFNYTPGVSETPEALRYDLTISGSTVSYNLMKPGVVSVKLYDAAGNLVSTLAAGPRTAGTHAAAITATPGVYFVKLVTPEYSAVRKAVIIK